MDDSIIVLSEDDLSPADSSVVVINSSSPPQPQRRPRPRSQTPPATSPVRLDPLSSSQPPVTASHAPITANHAPITANHAPITASHAPKTTADTIARLLAELDSDDDFDRPFAQVKATQSSSPPPVTNNTTKTTKTTTRTTKTSTASTTKASTITASTTTRVTQPQLPETPVRGRKRARILSSPVPHPPSTDPISSPSPSPPPSPPQTSTSTADIPYSGPGAEYIIDNPTPAQQQEANRVNRTKEEFLKQMTLFIPHHVYNTFDKSTLAHHFPDDRMDTYQCDIPLLYWRRRARCVWDANRRQFLACRPFNVDESIAVLFYRADDFINCLSDDRLANDVTVAKQTYPEIIVLVEGLELVYRNIRKLINAHHRADMLDKMGQPSARPKTPIPTHTVDDIVHSINVLQLHHRVNVFAVNSHGEVCQWLELLTHSVAERYYVASKDPRGGTHVKSGADAEGTFVSAMMQFRMVTRRKAQSLYSAFPSLQRVYDQLRHHGSIGVDSDDKNIVPPTVDRMMLKLFTADDPTTPVME